MSTPEPSTAGLLDATSRVITALSQMLAERPDLPPLYRITVEAHRYSGGPEVSLQLYRVGREARAADLAAWCDALGSPGGERWSDTAIAVNGRLAGLPTRIVSSLPSDLPERLPDQWTVEQLRSAAEGGPS